MRDCAVWNESFRLPARMTIPLQLAVYCEAIFLTFIAYFVYWYWRRDGRISPI